jgi:hypothetical protein
MNERITRFACAAGAALALAFAGTTPAGATDADAAAAAQQKLVDALLGGLGQNDLFQGIVGPLTQKILAPAAGDPLAGILADSHIEPKFYHVQGSTTDGVLGFDYNYQKAINNRVTGEDTDHPLGISWTVDAKGSVAADAKKNPNNLLESGTTLHLFQGIGGVRPMFTSEQAAAQARGRALMALAQDPGFLEQRGASYDAFANEVAAMLRPQFFWDLQAHATLESDQKFQQRAWTYGGKVAVALRDWRPAGEVGWFNVLDYPFAATRWFFDHDEFAPSGRTFPSLVLGLDQVDPAKDDARRKVDPNLAKFARGRAELAFKTRILRWHEKDLYVHSAYRAFRENGASAAIKQAHLDAFHYFVVKLDLPGQFFVSYATGKLPFDLKSEEVYALGWALHP